MKNGDKSLMTIFFVDVAGSVELYDSIGDILAHEKIVGCLNHMSSLIEKQGGRVVEIIGDEIMAAFTDPDQAFDAAMQIQKSLADESESRLGVRIGFHSGPTAVTEGHPFGDTVNVAARMVNLAKSSQIITNHHTVEELSEFNRARLRTVDKVFIKGKPDPYTIHEVVWDESECTMVLTLPQSGFVNRRRSEASLSLKYKGRTLYLGEASGEVVIGRGQRCGLIVDSGAASRMHAVVACRNGMMVIKDQSTNGTFIRTFAGKRATDGIELFIHHEEWMADATGVFSLGAAITKDDPNLIYFRIF
ncbi:MAG: adenylate/guanylate cyclase domain-containing protein [Gammaproteobacteria bacterium]